MSWKYDEARRGNPEAVAAVLDAARQQLGLKLVAGEGAINVLAIDRVQRPMLD